MLWILVKPCRPTFCKQPKPAMEELAKQEFPCPSKGKDLGRESPPTSGRSSIYNKSTYISCIQISNGYEADNSSESVTSSSSSSRYEIYFANCDRHYRPEELQAFQGAVENTNNNVITMQEQMLPSTSTLPLLPLGRSATRVLRRSNSAPDVNHQTQKRKGRSIAKSSVAGAMDKNNYSETKSAEVQAKFQPQSYTNTGGFRNYHEHFVKTSRSCTIACDIMKPPSTRNISDIIMWDDSEINVYYADFTSGSISISDCSQSGSVSSRSFHADYEYDDEGGVENDCNYSGVNDENIKYNSIVTPPLSALENSDNTDVDSEGNVKLEKKSSTEDNSFPLFNENGASKDSSAAMKNDNQSKLAKILTDDLPRDIASSVCPSNAKVKGGTHNTVRKELEMGDIEQKNTLSNKSKTVEISLDGMTNVTAQQQGQVISSTQSNDLTSREFIKPMKQSIPLHLKVLENGEHGYIHDKCNASSLPTSQAPRYDSEKETNPNDCYSSPLPLELVVSQEDIINDVPYSPTSRKRDVANNLTAPCELMDKTPDNSPDKETTMEVNPSKTPLPQDIVDAIQRAVANGDFDDVDSLEVDSNGYLLQCVEKKASSQQNQLQVTAAFGITNHNESREIRCTETTSSDNVTITSANYQTKSQISINRKNSIRSKSNENMPNLEENELSYLHKDHNDIFYSGKKVDVLSENTSFSSRKISPVSDSQEEKITNKIKEFDAIKEKKCPLLKNFPEEKDTKHISQTNKITDACNEQKKMHPSQDNRPVEEIVLEEIESKLCTLLNKTTISEHGEERKQYTVKPNCDEEKLKIENGKPLVPIWSCQQHDTINFTQAQNGPFEERNRLNPGEFTIDCLESNYDSSQGKKDKAILIADDKRRVKEVTGVLRRDVNGNKRPSVTNSFTDNPENINEDSESDELDNSIRSFPVGNIPLINSNGENIRTNTPTKGEFLSLLLNMMDDKVEMNKKINVNVSNERTDLDCTSPSNLAATADMDPQQKIADLYTKQKDAQQELTGVEKRHEKSLQQITGASKKRKDVEQGLSNFEEKRDKESQHILSTPRKRKDIKEHELLNRGYEDNFEKQLYKEPTVGTLKRQKDAEQGSSHVETKTEKEQYQQRYFPPSPRHHRQSLQQKEYVVSSKKHKETSIIDDKNDREQSHQNVATPQRSKMEQGQTNGDEPETEYNEKTLSFPRGVDSIYPSDKSWWSFARENLEMSYKQARRARKRVINRKGRLGRGKKKEIPLESMLSDQSLSPQNWHRKDGKAKGGNRFLQTSKSTKEMKRYMAKIRSHSNAEGINSQNPMMTYAKAGESFVKPKRNCQYRSRNYDDSMNRYRTYKYGECECCEDGSSWLLEERTPFSHDGDIYSALEDYYSRKYETLCNRTVQSSYDVLIENENSSNTNPNRNSGNDSLLKDKNVNSARISKRRLLVPSVVKAETLKKLSLDDEEYYSKAFDRKKQVAMWDYSTVNNYLCEAGKNTTAVSSETGKFFNTSWRSRNTLGTSAPTKSKSKDDQVVNKPKLSPKESRIVYMDLLQSKARADIDGLNKAEAVRINVRKSEGVLHANREQCKKRGKQENIKLVRFSDVGLKTVKNTEIEWNSTVTQMLLKSEKVKEGGGRINQSDEGPRYPRSESAKKVSAVPKKTFTFLNELLERDMQEQQRGYRKKSVKTSESRRISQSEGSYSSGSLKSCRASNSKSSTTTASDSSNLFPFITKKSYSSATKTKPWSEIISGPFHIPTSMIKRFDAYENPSPGTTRCDSRKDLNPKESNSARSPISASSSAAKRSAGPRYSRRASSSSSSSFTMPSTSAFLSSSRTNHTRKKKSSLTVGENSTCENNVTKSREMRQNVDVGNISASARCSSMGRSVLNPLTKDTRCWKNKSTENFQLGQYTDLFKHYVSPYMRDRPETSIVQMYQKW